LALYVATQNLWRKIAQTLEVALNDKHDVHISRQMLPTFVQQQTPKQLGRAKQNKQNKQNKLKDAHAKNKKLQQDC
jgi:hypothetical protein